MHELEIPSHAFQTHASRLATRSVRVAIAAFSQGVYLVDLAASTQPADIDNSHLASRERFFRVSSSALFLMQLDDTL